MAWADAKQIAEEWAGEHLPADLRGRMVQLVSFETHADARFFYPDRNQEFHQMVTSAIARLARKRGAKTSYATLTSSMYEEWRETQGVTDSNDARRSFADSMHHVIEL